MTNPVTVSYAFLAKGQIENPMIWSYRGTVQSERHAVHLGREMRRTIARQTQDDTTILSSFTLKQKGLVPWADEDQPVTYLLADSASFPIFSFHTQTARMLSAYGFVNILPDALKAPRQAYSDVAKGFRNLLNRCEEDMSQNDVAELLLEKNWLYTKKNTKSVNTNEAMLIADRYACSVEKLELALVARGLMSDHLTCVPTMPLGEFVPPLERMISVPENAIVLSAGGSRVIAERPIDSFGYAFERSLQC